MGQQASWSDAPGVQSKWNSRGPVTPADIQVIIDRKKQASAPGTRTRGDIALDQMAAGGEGMLSNIDPRNLPGMWEQAKTLGMNPSTLPAMAVQSALGLARPYITAAKGAISGRNIQIPGYGALQMPELPEGDPDNPAWSQAARGAGQQAGGILLGEAAAAAPGVARAGLNAATTPEAMLTRAAANKVPMAGGSTLLDHASHAAAAGAGYLAGGPTGAAAAELANLVRMALKTKGVRGGIASGQEGIARFMAGADVAPEMSVPPTPPQFETPTVQPPAVIGGLNTRPMAAPENRPPLPSYDEGSAALPNRASPMQPSVIARDNEAWLRAQGNAGDLHMETKPSILSPSSQLPFSGELGPSPEPQLNISDLREAIRPSGNKAKLATIRLLPTQDMPLLVQEVPEIVGLKKGPAFDTALVKGFRKAEQNVISTEDMIPDTAIVPRDPIVAEIDNIAAKYAQHANPKISAALEKLVKTWKEMPEQIPWDQFIKAKRAFFDEVNPNSAPMREAYKPLIDASSAVSPELSQANKSYSVVRRALDAGNFDVRTGERVADVGKPITPQAMQEILKRGRQ